MINVQEQDTLLTVREVAKALRVDPLTVKRWIGAGVLVAIRLPGGLRSPYRVKQSVVDGILGRGK